jgi:adenine deaminase
METPGASLEAEDVAEALTWPGVIGLGEVMNFYGVAGNETKIHAEIEAALRAGKIIGGHYASPDLGSLFHGYAAGGAEDDHEGTSLADAVARARQGMKVMMRFGSAWHDVAAQVRSITEMGLDPRHFILCTDDSHCGTLVQEGHVNRAVKMAISQGVSPLTAIQMATLNTAEHFGVARQVGQIAPGRWADVLLVTDLPTLQIQTVIARGQVAVQDGKNLATKPAFKYPEWARNSVRLRQPASAADFHLAAPSKKRVLAHVIGIIENQAPNRHVRLSLPVKDGEVQADYSLDLAKIAVIERHNATGRIQVGLMQGLGLQAPCAIATTVAHDCHHLIVVGTSDSDMALAVNELTSLGGGQMVVKDGQVIGKVALPIGGLMSDQPAQDVAAGVASITTALQTCGCRLNNSNMQISLAALVVIPELRLSDLGLVDVTKFQFIPVLESES